MDIKFSFVRVLLFFSILTLVVSTTSAGYRGRGTGRITSRRHSRREVSNHLTPPSQDASYTSYGPPSIQQHQPQLHRPGPVRIPPPSTEAPGSFSKFFSWLNPYSESPTKPPRPDTQVPRYGPPNASPSSYQRPPSSPHHSYGLPQLPPAGRHSYLPPGGNGKSCHPCDDIPWIPMADGVQKDTDTSGATNFEIQPSINEGINTPNFGFPSSYIPDFTYRPLNHFASNENPYSAPIPYAHLYPGPMPPLFKSRPFTPSPDFHPTPSIQLDSGLLDHTSDSIVNDGGHVEVLPPGAEVHVLGDVGEIRDSPPPGYEDDHHGGGYGSTSLNVEPSTVIHEDHLSTELTAGYKVETPSAASVEVIQSIPSASIPTSVDHPIHYEESPVIDLSNQNQNGPGGGDKDYTAGLNPPPNESPRSYGSQENEGSNPSKNTASQDLKNSYGIYVNHEQTRDSFVASTVTNRTFSYPTPSYGIPDIGGLPISHEATKPTTYESYPPMDSSKNGGAHHNDSSHEQGINADHQDHGRIVDSYRQHIDQSSNNPNQQNGQLGFLNTPKPLVPYRPSSLYVPYPPYSGINFNQNRLPSSEPSGSTTEESFLDAVVNSYANFKQEMDAKDNSARPGVVYVPYPPYSGLNFNQNSLSPSEPTSSTTEQSFLDAVANSYANFKHEMDTKDNLNGADVVYVPYPPYSGPNFNRNNSSPSEPSRPTTEASFLDDVANSYVNFKQEMDSKHQSVHDQQDGLKNANQNDQPPINSGSSSGTTWVSQPQPSFSNPEQINPTVYVNGKISPPSSSSFETKQRQSGVKKNKQVQIIIPYTSQHTPSPFQPVTDDWSGRGPLEQIQGRKVPVLTSNDQNYVGQESNKVEIIRPLKPLENLLSKEIFKKPSSKQANNSIDVSKLQKNIDNWTIQEYSRGITASTALPSFSHPYLLPAKKIPKEYLNKNQTSVSNNATELNQSNLPGFNYNDLEHEGSSSIRVDVPHVQVVTVMGVSKPVDYKTTQSSTTVTSTEATTSSSSVVTSTSTTTTEASWAELPVSISSHNNERVYVVTPLPERSAKSWPGFSELDKSGKFEAIERVYQVLPQAVNNLATTSVSGPEHSPLWGIMEHDQYARSDNEISSTSIPILYSGHSKVSNTKSH